MSVSCVYKIYSKNEKLKAFYIGSSFDIVKRMRKHKSDVNNKMSVCYNYPLYQYIRTHGGTDNFVVELLEHFDDDKLSWSELKKKEQSWIDTLKPSFNSNRAYNNLEDHQRYRHLYFIKNRSRINSRRHQKRYCECGGRYTVNNKSAHLKSMKHLKFEVKSI